jgi:hypothetical protein
MVEYSSYFGGSQWEKITEIDTEKGYAVPKRGNTVIINDKELRVHTLRSYLEGLGIIVYGISRSRYEKMRKELGLASLEDKLKVIANDFVTTVTPMEMSRIHYGNTEFVDLYKKITGLSAECDNLIVMNQTKDRHKEFRIASLMQVTHSVQSTDHAEVFRRKYPLLECIRYYGDVEIGEHIVNYIKLVEKKS